MQGKGNCTICLCETDGREPGCRGPDTDTLACKICGLCTAVDGWGATAKSFGFRSDYYSCGHFEGELAGPCGQHHIVTDLGKRFSLDGEPF